MIDWKILNYLNKQKYKRILLITKNYNQIKKFVNNPCITVIEEKNFLEHYPENAYHIISTWELLSEGASVFIYTYLAKMNHLLRDDGQLYLRVLHNQNHFVEFDTPPFCWNIERIDSFGKTKGLKLYKEAQKITTKKASFLRFRYIPAI